MISNCLCHSQNRNVGSLNSTSEMRNEEKISRIPQEIISRQKSSSQFSRILYPWVFWGHLKKTNPAAAQSFWVLVSTWFSTVHRAKLLKVPTTFHRTASVAPAAVPVQVILVRQSTKSTKQTDKLKPAQRNSTKLWFYLSHAQGPWSSISINNKTPKLIREPVTCFVPDISILYISKC